MKKCVAGCVTVCVLALASVSAQASYLTGNELLEKMQSTLPFNHGVILGYVSGVIDRINMDKRAGAQPGMCPPASVTLGQVRDIVKQYLKQNPAIRHHDASALILNAMAKTFPCPKTR